MYQQYRSLSAKVAKNAMTKQRALFAYFAIFAIKNSLKQMRYS